jgi:hypothetical protein
MSGHLPRRVLAVTELLNEHGELINHLVQVISVSMGIKYGYEEQNVDVHTRTHTHTHTHTHTLSKANGHTYIHTFRLATNCLESMVFVFKT